MSFCKNCGSELAENEKFCGNCGTPLSGPVPNTPNPNTRYMDSNSKPVSNINFNNLQVYLAEILNLTVNMITKPISTILKRSRTLKKETIFLLYGMLSIIFGLLNMWNIKAITVRAASSSRGLSLSIGIEDIFEEISSLIPYGKIFFYTLLFFLISIAILFIANHLIGKYIFKLSCNPMNIFTIAVCSSIPFILGFLALIILSYFSATIGFIGIFIGIVISLLCLFMGMTSELVLSEDKMAFIIPISYLLMFLADYGLLKIILKS